MQHRQNLPKSTITLLTLTRFDTEQVFGIHFKWHHEKHKTLQAETDMQNIG